jgi:hypothetical protein
MKIIYQITPFFLKIFVLFSLFASTKHYYTLFKDINFNRLFLEFNDYLQEKKHDEKKEKPTQGQEINQGNPNQEEETTQENPNQEEETKQQEKPNQGKPNQGKETKKTKPKYEDKYLDAVRILKKEYDFTEEERSEIDELFVTNSRNITKMYEEEIYELNQKLGEIKTNIKNLEKMTNEEFIHSTYFSHKSKEETIRTFYESWKYTEKVISGLEEKINDTDKKIINEQALLNAEDVIIKRRIEKLKGCFAMEYTPLGNVLMTYNIARNSFSYYSDSTIPYRYLEVVARKFVKTFHCRSIFVDMEEELKNYEKKIEKKVEEEKKKKEELLKNQVSEQKQPNKNVFAKLKNYNKSSGKVNTAPPPKSSIPNNTETSSKNENCLLKDNANSYTYEGKISTFNVLKKVERKVVDKKYNITFADFKKLKAK